MNLNSSTTIIALNYSRRRDSRLSQGAQQPKSMLYSKNNNDNIYSYSKNETKKSFALCQISADTVEWNSETYHNC